MIQMHNYNIYPWFCLSSFFILLEYWFFRQTRLLNTWRNRMQTLPFWAETLTSTPGTININWLVEKWQKIQIHLFKSQYFVYIFESKPLLIFFIEVTTKHFLNSALQCVTESWNSLFLFPLLIQSVSFFRASYGWQAFLIQLNCFYYMA